MCAAVEDGLAAGGGVGVSAMRLETHRFVSSLIYFSTLALANRCTRMAAKILW